MSDQISKPMIGAVVGFGYGLVLAVTGMLMTGAGHGWNNAGMSVFALVIGPFAGMVSVGTNRSKLVKFGKVAAITSIVLFDLFLMVETLMQETRYVAKVAEKIPLIFMLWVVAFIVAHIHVMLNFVRSNKTASIS